MKVNLSKVCACLFLAVASIMIQPLSAQDAPPAPAAPSGGGEHHSFKFLSPAENDQLKTAREAVFAANPDLKTEGEDLHKQMKALRDNPSATPEDKKALHEKMKDHEEAVRDAMLKVDPTLQPIFDKIAEHMKDHNKPASAN